MQNDTCYILALFKRDDGQRLLLGSGYYTFKNSQKHFTPNTFANDIVELQGTDGQLLAGQVRRSSSQSFDGFVGNGTTPRSTVEQKRREFFLFFRKQHHYTVVYIFPDGTAIKRDRGYITDAPSVPELYQVQPTYHVALAFEDVNYYSYAEDQYGNEIYSFNATLGLANIEDGGLVWDANGATSDALVAGGKNLFDKRTAPLYAAYISAAAKISGSNLAKLTSDGNRITYIKCEPNTTYTITKPNQATTSRNRFRIATQDVLNIASGVVLDNMWMMSDGGTTTTHTYTTGANAHYMVLYIGQASTATNPGGEIQDVLDGLQIELGSTASAYEPFMPTGGYIFAASTGGGPVTVTVNGVDSAQPVWHVIGPATNPTLTNSTTGQALTWTGTIPSGQELIIDMGAQTATMEGANVFEFVSGSWVLLAPGNNRISYTAANTTASSTIYWNEVVG